MKLLKSIFSIDSAFFASILLCIFLVPATLSAGVRTIYGYFNLRNMTSIEGPIKHLSISVIELEGVDTSFPIKNECECKITPALISKAKFAHLKITNNNELAALIIDDITIFDDYQKFQDRISITFTFASLLLCAIMILLLTKKIMHKQYEKQRAVLKEIAKELAPKVNHLKVPALRIHKTSMKANSKFGGLPTVDLENFSWPNSNGTPLTFLAQLDLAEIAQIINFDWLPQYGSLLFFYNTQEMPWGYEPDHKSGWKVIYYKNPSTIAETPKAMQPNAILPEIFITFTYIEILPPGDSEQIESLHLSEEESDAYNELLLNEDEGSTHQIGGFAAPVQGNIMQEQAQLTLNGISTGGAYDDNNPQIVALQSGISDWKLLLQMDSEEDLDLMWGDLGMIYFWVEAKKSKTGNFDDTWLILQCT